MESSQSQKRRKKAKKALHPVLSPNQKFDEWRIAVALKLHSRRGRCSQLARRFGVASSLVSDWFTLRRSMPPAVVVFDMLNEGENLWPQ